jgi:hypothetical protein
MAIVAIAIVKRAGAEDDLLLKIVSKRVMEILYPEKITNVIRS